MPVVHGATFAAIPAGSAGAARRFPLNVLAGATTLFSDAMLQVNSYPNCFWWVLIGAGAPPGITFQPLFAVDNIAGVGGPVPRFRPLMAPIVVVVGTPLFVTQRVMANMISGILVVPGGGAGAATEIILAGSL